jgi:hypothetical protein
MRDLNRIEVMRSRAHRRKADPSANLERAKSLATIFSAVAIPIVLTVAGYFIQKQLANDGLKKDYVGIAAGILKENPANQEPELRAWAISVLDDNSPIPFSKKAKEGLLTGLPIVVPGPAWIGPPDDCRTPVKKRTVLDEFHKLNISNTTTAPEVIEKLAAFVDVVIKQEKEVSLAFLRLECLQNWTKVEEESDIRYRQEIGAPSSKSIVEEYRQKKVQATAAAASSSGSTKGAGVDAQPKRKIGSASK